MVEPVEALDVASQVSVALAGFAGIVAAFGRGPIHEWPPAAKLRLKFLLATALLPLAWSLIGLALLAMPVAAEATWQISSTLACMTLAVSCLGTVRDYLTLSRTHLREDQSSRWFFIGSMSAAGVAVLLQAWNVFALKAFWPFFAMVVAAMVVCMLQFVRFVLDRPPVA